MRSRGARNRYLALETGEVTGDQGASPLTRTLLWSAASRPSRCRISRITSASAAPCRRTASHKRDAPRSLATAKT